MRIAIIGTGISGLTAAAELHPHHDITIYEAAPYVGGHTHTVDVPWQGEIYPVDTGFIVFNHRTYPRFTAMLQRLGVAAKPSTMSFSVRHESTGLEYSGTSLDTLFAQRRNLLSPSFLVMVRDILRFNRRAKAWLAGPDAGPHLTLDEFLEQHRFSRPFIDWYVLPMGSAIWSAGQDRLREFPALFFLRFLDNHGMLSIDDRPTWRVVEGGSRTYVDALTAPFRERILLDTPVTAVLRERDRVRIFARGVPPASFDQVVLAVHADQALAMLVDPSRRERDILGALPYRENEAVLHTDTSILPRKHKAWASWNYHIPRHKKEQVAVTYNMNILQGLTAPVTFCVTLNHEADLDPAKVICRMTYHHPEFTPEAMMAQQRHGEISDHNRTHFCGAYWFNGFHEDGVRSGLRVAEALRYAREEVPV